MGREDRHSDGQQRRRIGRDLMPDQGSDGPEDRNFRRPWEANEDADTVEETAKYLSISRTFAYEAVRRGELPSIRVGRRLLVPRIALDKMLGEARSSQQVDCP